MRGVFNHGWWGGSCPAWQDGQFTTLKPLVGY
jgi:hypothetical protein